MLGKIELFGKRQALGEKMTAQIGGSACVAANAVPSLNIMDEYKYISVPGMSIAATQGRSLGWASIVGVQSYAGLCVDGEQEADEWLENTATKFIGAAQGDSTFSKLNRIVGREYTARSAGKSLRPGLLANRGDKTNIRFEKQDVLDIRDLRAQRQGQFTVVIGDREIRMQTLFVDNASGEDSVGARLSSRLRLNAFMSLPPVSMAAAKKVRDSQLFYETHLQRAVMQAEDLPSVDHRLVELIEQLQTSNPQ